MVIRQIRQCSPRQSFPLYGKCKCNGQMTIPTNKIKPKWLFIPSISTFKLARGVTVYIVLQ